MLLRFFWYILKSFGFPGGSDGKESVCNAAGLGLIHGSRRSLGEGNSYPLKYSCLENSIDRGAWQATVHGVAKESDMTERLSLHFTSKALLFPSLYKWIYFWWSFFIELSLIHTFQRLPPASLYFYLNIWWISGKVLSYRKLSPFRISQSNYLKGELSIF